MRRSDACQHRVRHRPCCLWTPDAEIASQRYACTGCVLPNGAWRCTDRRNAPARVRTWPTPAPSGTSSRSGGPAAAPELPVARTHLPAGGSCCNVPAGPSAACDGVGAGAASLQANPGSPDRAGRQDHDAPRRC